jgi:hypothetical protein
MLIRVIVALVAAVALATVAGTLLRVLDHAVAAALGSAA